MFHPGSVRFRPRSLLSVIVLFVIGLSVVPGHVQASGPVLDKLNPAESKIGIISAQNPAYRYEITARAGDEVLAGLTGDEDFSPALELHTGSADKPGSQLAIGLSDPKSTASLLLDYVVPGDGTYTLFVKAGAAKGAKVGRFAIIFALVTVKKPVAGTAQGDVLPTNGFALTGKIENAVVRTVYRYDGNKGDQLELVMTGASGLVPALSIQKDTYSATGTPVASADGKPGFNTAQVGIEYELPAAGTYYIVATRATANKGNSIGPYRIALSANGSSVQDGLAPASSFSQPSQMPATIDTTGDPAGIMGRLRDQGLVPAGGELATYLPANYFIQSSLVGLQAFPLTVQGDVSARNFVANIQVVWTKIGDASSCGVGFWSVSSAEFGIAMLSSTGLVSLYQRSGSQMPINYLAPSSLYESGSLTTITLIVIGDSVSLYINGHFQTTAKGHSRYGYIETALLNVPGNTKLTVCNYKYGWVWRY